MNDQDVIGNFNMKAPDPAFLAHLYTGLHVIAGMESLDIFAHYMVFMLRRQPKNLKRHVQYIMALIDRKSIDDEAVFAAVVDLFIILENRGLSLRRRMLSLARPYLRDDDFSFLLNSLSTGITGFTPLRQGNRSSLTRACTGHCNFIRKLNVRENSVFASLYDEAMSLIEYGDIAEAQALLEQALRMQPDDEKTAAELVAIYEHRNDAEALAGMGQWYITNNLTLPNCWPLL